jgi:hypothetical protein
LRRPHANAYNATELHTQSIAAASPDRPTSKASKLNNRTMVVIWRFLYVTLRCRMKLFVLTLSKRSDQGVPSRTPDSRRLARLLQQNLSPFQAPEHRLLYMRDQKRARRVSSFSITRQCDCRCTNSSIIKSATTLPGSLTFSLVSRYDLADDSEPFLALRPRRSY